MQWALCVAGVFTISLGIAHLFLPQIVAFDAAVADAPRPLSFPFVQYNTTKRDMMGVIRVMNYAVSFALVSIGAADLILFEYLHQPLGRAAATWIACWWLIRAAAQLHLGIRWFDCGAMVGFLLLGALHGIAALR